MPLIGLAPDTFTWLHPGGDGGDDVDDWVASLTIIYVEVKAVTAGISITKAMHTPLAAFRGRTPGLRTRRADLSNLPLPQYHLILQ